MSAPDTSVTDDRDRHRFEIRVGGELAGYAVYRREPDVTCFVHTSVDSAFEGRGLGSTLVRGALDATRAAGESVVPECPFVRHFISTHPEYLPMVPPARRAEFGLD